MKTQKITIENLKCGGCANTIKKGLASISGISDIQINIESSEISFNGSLDSKKLAVEKLTQLGYPEVGTLSGIASGVANAKSYVSCAIGKISN